MSPPDQPDDPYARQYNNKRGERRSASAHASRRNNKSRRTIPEAEEGGAPPADEALPVSEADVLALHQSDAAPSSSDEHDDLNFDPDEHWAAEVHGGAVLEDPHQYAVHVSLWVSLDKVSHWIIFILTHSFPLPFPFSYWPL